MVHLATVEPHADLPLDVQIDLRRAPLNWSGERDFEIVVDLVPVSPANGFSASFELDCLGVATWPGGAACDPGSTLFVDGFESGDTKAWSGVE